VREVDVDNLAGAEDDEDAAAAPLYAFCMNAKVMTLKLALEVVKMTIWPRRGRGPGPSRCAAAVAKVDVHLARVGVHRESPEQMSTWLECV
jgi:hypothetical protein